MKYVVCTLFVLVSLNSYGVQLSNEALFNRCYSHLTKKRLNSTHALLDRVKNGSIEPIEACLSIFNKATLRGNGRITTNDSESKSVIKNMTEFHNSYFSEKSIRSLNSCFKRATLDVRDELTPALYFTRALLTTNAKFSDILVGTKEVRGIRSNASPANRGPASNAAGHTNNIGGTATPWNVSSAFLGSGDLIGVEEAPRLILPQYNQDVLSSIGGGVIGSRTYLQRAYRGQRGNSDGGVRMNRRWAQAVARDFLCRELPLVRETDGLPFIKTASPVAFRTQSACIGCHATMDRMAGAVRGASSIFPGRGNCNLNTNARSEHMFLRTPDRASADTWPSTPDRDYYRRPAEGYLYFRSYNGDLIHKKFSGIEELGKHLSDTNDLYVCAAKKYYQFFTGVEVSLADINDPFTTVKLNEEDLKHRDKVIKLGLDLKNHQSLGKLLKDIISLPNYKLSDYGIQGGM